MEVKYDEEDLGLILLCSLPSSYVTFSDIIFYSHDTLTLDKVYDALYSKEKMKQLVVGSEAQGEVWLFEGGHMRGILMVMQRVGQSLKIKTKSATTAKRRGILNLSATTYRIRIRELLLVRRKTIE